MAKHVVARVDDVPEGGRLFVDVGGRSIGIFNVGGRFHALLNRCPHQGAKLCRGSVIGRVEADGPGNLSYDGERRMLQCPWHGWEYDIETGQSFFDSAVRPYPVGVEHGGELTEALPLEAPPVLGLGTSAPTLKAGPFKAETFPVFVDDEYLVLALPGERRMRLTVAARREEADGVVSLELAAPGGAALPPWAPGAHIDLLLGPDLRRQFSLCGSRGDRWRIGVLREVDGRGGSAFVHDHVHEGDVLEVVGPRNNFPLIESDRYRFVAGGIGITPLLPMIAAAEAAGADWSLLYGGRTRASMAFVDELEPYGDRVTFLPQDEHGLLPLEQFLGGDALVYCCGPEPLIAAVEAICPAHVERFRPKPGALDGPSEAFEVVCEDSGITVAVGAGESIIEAVEAAGIDVPSSCREGTCGTCETEVLEGVPDHRDSFLGEAEREAGDTMMICCGRARSTRLVLGL